METTYSCLVLSGALGDTRRYRILNLYQQFRLAGMECRLSHHTDPHWPSLAQQASLMVIHRVPMDAYSARIIAQFHQRGGVLLVDTDDLIFDPEVYRYINSPDFKDPVRAALYQENMVRHRQALEQSDAVLVSTNFLGEFIRKFGKPFRVHRNAYSLELAALSDQAYQQRKPDPDRVVIGYASGTPTHNRDFAMLRPALIQVMERFPQTELWLLGTLEPGEDWERFSGRIRRFPLVPWRRLPERLAQLDINLTPLVTDNPFSQSKSEIKYMEAGLVGVPTVASPNDAFRYAIRSEQNGFLAANEREWVEALASLITDPTRRQTLGEAARQDILAQYSPYVRARQLRDALRGLGEEIGHPELVSLPGEPVTSVDVPQQYNIPPDYEQHPTLFERGLFLLRRGDWIRLLGMVWVQFRRWLAPIFPF